MPPILTTSPDPNTRTPKFKCPPGTVDTHIHLFGPAEKYTWDPNTYYVARDATPEMNIALQDRLGFTNSVIVSGGAYGRNYTHLADTLTCFPDRFRGVALIPDDLSDAEFVRLGKLGVRGMRVFSASRGGVLPTISEKISARAHEHGWHIQFYPHGADITEFADKLLALPNVITLDHFASVKAEGGLDQPGFKKLLRMLDTYAAVTPMARALVAHRPDRLVFGTDWPHVNMDGRKVPNDGDLVDLIPEWIEGAADRQTILVDNARKLYGFPAVATRA
jgi:predicted TIM-barrel fold metal-dependent hydrolase